MTLKILSSLFIITAILGENPANFSVATITYKRYMEDTKGPIEGMFFNATSKSFKESSNSSEKRSGYNPMFAPSAGVPYFIYSAFNGKILEVGEKRDDNGAQIRMWPYQKSDFQKWFLYNEGQGYYRIISNRGRKSMDVSAASLEEGAQVVLWEYSGYNHQLWYIEYQTGTGLLTFQAKHSGQCLDVFGKNNLYGAPVGQWSCNNAINQKWYLFPAEGCD